jgi:hypothetical protein
MTNYTNEQKAAVLREARQHIERADAALSNKAAAITLQPMKDEPFDSWMPRCIADAMSQDPNLTEDRASDQCSIVFEEAQVLGRPGGLHSYRPYFAKPDDGSSSSWPADAPKFAKIPLVSALPQIEWNRDSLRRQQAKLREDVHRRLRAREERSNTAVVYDQQLDDRINAAVAQAIADEREFVSDVLVKLTAHLKGEIRKLRDELQALRTEHQQHEAAFWKEHFGRADAGKQDHGSVVTLPAKRVS